MKNPNKPNNIRECVDVPSQFVILCYGFLNNPDTIFLRQVVPTNRMTHHKLNSAPKLRDLPSIRETFYEHVTGICLGAVIWIHSIPAPCTMNDPWMSLVPALILKMIDWMWFLIFTPRRWRWWCWCKSRCHGLWLDTFMCQCVYARVCSIDDDNNNTDLVVVLFVLLTNLLHMSVIYIY